MNHARAHAVPLRLIDGLLVYVQEAERQATMERMAKVLLDHDAIHDKRDSVSILLCHGFHSLKVAYCLDEVRALAFQDIVAAEMVKD